MTVAKRDYWLVAIIGFCFGVFSLPILKNVTTLGLSAVRVAGIIVFFTIAAVVALWIAGLIAKKVPVILQIAKFCAVGGFNTFLDWGVLNLLIALTGIATGIGFSVFKSTSFLVASVSSYFWNRYWTFEAGGKASAQEFGKFFAVNIVGFVINVGIASLIVDLIHPIDGLSAAQWANVGALVGTLVALSWNFIGFKFFVFAPKKESVSQPI